MAETPSGNLQREVPDVTGARAQLAASILTQAGFRVLFIDPTGERTDEPAPAAVVHQQMPTGRRHANIGTDVALYLR